MRYLERRKDWGCERRETEIEIETRAMMPFKKCPVCGGELVSKEVEKVLRGGNHTAVVKAFAEVCLHCGERLYSSETIKRFEEIRAKLEREETADFQPVGRSFQV